MKGCLAVLGGIVILIVLVVVGFGGYAFYKGRQFSERVEAAVAELEKTNEANPWTRPADGKLDPARLPVWFEVRTNSSGSIRTTLERIQSVQRHGDNQKEPSFSDVKEMVGGMIGAFVDVPHDLAASLAPARMSWKEFKWHCTTVLSTVILAAKQQDPEATKLLDRIEKTIREAWEGGPGVESFRKAKEHIKSSESQFDPENLAIVLANQDRIAGEAAVLMLDCFMQDSSNFGGKEADAVPPKGSTPGEAGK